MEKDLVRLRVVGVTYNQIENGMYAMVLEEEGGCMRLPIIIGYNEAQSIECQLQKIKTPRPLMHEFASSVFGAFDIEIESVVVNQLPNGIFTADIALRKGDERHVLDARSSDAIAMAMRSEAPIMIARELLEKCGINKDSFSQTPNHIVANQSIPARQAVERVKKPEAGDYSRMSAEQLLSLMQNAVDTEDYEKAAEIKTEMERRNISIDEQEK